MVAFSCKGRGVCPSCNTRRMAEAAAHLCDHVFPRLPVRQWVLSVPKRIRYYLQRDKGALNAALHIFLRAVQQSLQAHCPSAAQCDPVSLRLGAVAFIHRFGSNLNAHVHFHVCVVDGVFEPLPAGVQPITFHPAQIDEVALAQMQTQVQNSVRKRLLRAFVARGHLGAHDAKEMSERGASSQHGGGFSVDAGVRIEAADRAGLERLLRYCARPPFAMDRLKRRGADLVYRMVTTYASPAAACLTSWLKLLLASCNCHVASLKMGFPYIVDSLVKIYLLAIILDRTRTDAVSILCVIRKDLAGTTPAPLHCGAGRPRAALRAGCGQRSSHAGLAPGLPFLRPGADSTSPTPAARGQPAG